MQVIASQYGLPPLKSIFCWSTSNDWGFIKDLAKSATFDGILFHDDATLSDYEDASPDAMKAYASIGLTEKFKISTKYGVIIAKMDGL